MIPAWIVFVVRFAASWVVLGCVLAFAHSTLRTFAEHEPRFDAHAARAANIILVLALFVFALVMLAIWL